MLAIILSLFLYDSRYSPLPSPESTDDQLQTLNEDTQWPSEPMAMSLNYWEQTANALKNLFDLQCWAKSVNINKVAEPSIRPGGFRYVASERFFKFGDIFDTNSWNNLSIQYGYSPLVSLQYFVKHATKELIFVQVLHKPWDHCKPQSAFFKSDWYKFLTSKGFHIRTECTDFHRAPSHSMSCEVFKKTIFGKTEGNVSLLFSLWEGVHNVRNERIALKGSQCNANYSRIAGYSAFK